MFVKYNAMHERKEILEAITALNNGQLVVFPTETVYGLGANALDASAVAKIYEAKERPHFNPLIVHIPSIDFLDQVASEVAPELLHIAKHFWPGPLSIVVPKSNQIPDLVTAGLPTVAVRMPNHAVALELLRAFGKPIAAPSANMFTQTSPTSSAHAKASLGDKVSVYLEGKPSAVGVESTIIGYAKGKFILYREGGISQEELEPLTGKLQIATTQEKPITPGSMDFHYAPKVPLYLADRSYPSLDFEKTAILSWNPITLSHPYHSLKVLSEKENLAEVATNLFCALRELETLPITAILAYPPPQTGIGRAVYDRLERASQNKRINLSK